MAVGGTHVCSFSVEVTGDAGYEEVDRITVSGNGNDGQSTTASDDDLVPAVVSATAPAEVTIVTATVAVKPQLPTDRLLTTDRAEPLNGGTSLAELLRLFVLFVAATVLIGGLGSAVVRRERA